MPSQTGSRKDPYSGFRFLIEIGDIVGGFSECSGLGLETEVFEYQEGGVNDYVHKLPTRTKQGNITLKRGVVDSLLWDWYLETLPGEVDLKSGTIEVTATADDSTLMWLIVEAFPRKIQGPDLNAGQSSVAVETLEICHHGLWPI